MIKEKFIKSGRSVDEELIINKAIGLSSAIDSALGYWIDKPKSLNLWVLSRYYALLQFTIAEQVSSPNNDNDLRSVQKQTEHGHGLAIWHKDIESPLDFKIYSLKSGHFYSYAKYLGYSPDNWSSDKRVREASALTTNNSISLEELIQCIPELEPVLYSFIQKTSHCLHIGYSRKNHEEQSRMQNERNIGISTNLNQAESKRTIVSIFENIDNPISLQDMRCSPKNVQD